jgi:hypothetical protein
MKKKLKINHYHNTKHYLILVIDKELRTSQKRI